MTTKKRLSLLLSMQEHACVSGREGDLCDFLAETADCPFQKDGAGNLYFTLKGTGENKRRLLLEAHLDEIGLVISRITDEGYLACQTVGGMKKEDLPGTKVTVFGKVPFPAVIGSKPPHLSKIKTDENKDAPVYLTAGFESKEDAEKWVKPGDAVHYFGPAKLMQNGRILSRGLDNKVGVLALLETFSRLKKPYHDVTFLLSAGEETTGRGAKIFTNDRSFDLAVVVDAGFGGAEGIDPTHTLKMGGGPSISITEREHLKFEKRVIEIARKASLPCQVIAEPGGTGTNSTYIQTRHGGIPTAVLSIPILNMHTGSEIVAECDIEDASKLLAAVANEKDLSVGKKVQYLGA